MLFFIFFVLVSCCVASKLPINNSENLHKRVYIDTNFSPDERVFINEALKEWECSTKHLINFTIISDENDSDLSIKSIKPTNKFIIDADLRLNTDKVVMGEDPNRDSSTQYQTVGLHNQYSNPPTIFIVQNRIDRNIDVRAIVMHEIGHDLGIKHIKDENSIMFINRTTGSQHITNLDLKAFCDLHDCKNLKLKACSK
jgi:predicted Zn-dependent protease